jgi:two-component system, NarL family, response regulator LiaR
MTTDSRAKITVLVVDDHLLVRQGLRTLLELHEDIEIVGEAEDGATAVESACRLVPDVILMDIVMPEKDGLVATREILALHPTIKIIVLTSYGDDDKVFPAIEAGASGYLLKNVAPSELIGAIRAAYRGQAQLNPDITKKLMDRFAMQAKERLPDELTERESAVLRLIAAGLSNRDIALELVISEKTVKVHVSSILNKLHLADRTQAAIYAIRKGVAQQH